jgi:hypothetical protein
MSIKRKQRLAIDLYKEAIEYTPFELNEKLSGELNALNDFIESKADTDEEEEMNAFVYLVNAIETCLPYFKTQMMCSKTNTNKVYTKQEVENKLIDDYLNNNQNDAIAEMNINDWCVQNGFFNIEEEQNENQN